MNTEKDLPSAGDDGSLQENTVYRKAFKMQLKHGFTDVYKQRHDAIWHELKELLKALGISDYSIFLDETTDNLFGVLKTNNINALDDLALHPIMQKWWANMIDIMESNPDNSPVSIPLTEVFHLP